MKTRLMLAALSALPALAIGSHAFAGNWTNAKSPGTNCSGVQMCAQVTNPGVYHSNSWHPDAWRAHSDDARDRDNRWHKRNDDSREQNRHPLSPYGRLTPLSTGVPY